MDNAELSFFKRYLKDNGLWSAFKNDLSISRPYKCNFHEYVKEEKNRSSCIIMDCLLWSIGKYRDWCDIYTSYAKYFEENYENYKKTYLLFKKEKL
jgi:hypothetical protein